MHKLLCSLYSNKSESFHYVCYYFVDDVIFMDTDFTLSVGARTCFDVIIIDDTEIESNIRYRIDVTLQSGGYNEQFYDRRYFRIIDNDGE